jgi:uncharacterized protein
LQIEHLREIVRARMVRMEGTAHSYDHVARVVRIATFLAKKEKADVELVQVGALLHDVGWSSGQPHNETGAKLAVEILREIGCDQEKAEKIVGIILHHPIDLKDQLETLEERIVWDADKIDLLGAVGVARGFHWYGKKPFETVVRLAFDTYTPIYTMLNTSSARQLAKRRYEETMSFLSALEKELSLADLGIS